MDSSYAKGRRLGCTLWHPKYISCGCWEYEGKWADLYALLTGTSKCHCCRQQWNRRMAALTPLVFAYVLVSFLLGYSRCG